MTIHPRRCAATALVIATVTATGALPAGSASADLARRVPRCLGKAATIVGSGVIHGSRHADVIVATDTGSEVYAGGGADRVCGAFLVHGEEGDDRIRFGGGEPSGQLTGGPGDDRIVWDGASGAIPELRGGAGADTLSAPQAGGQVLAGGGGPDVLSAGPGGDWVSGGRGVDTAYAGRGEDVCSSVERAHGC